MRSAFPAGHNQDRLGRQTDDEQRFDGMPSLSARIKVPQMFLRAFNRLFGDINHDRLKVVF